MSRYRFATNVINFPLDQIDPRIWIHGRIQANPIKTGYSKALMTGQILVPINMINLYHDHKVVRYEHNTGTPYLLFGFNIFEEHYDQMWGYKGYVNYAAPCMSQEVFQLVKDGNPETTYKRFTGF